MFDLPEQFCDLAPLRQNKLQHMVGDERQDAAMNCVLIGLKALNQVHHLGLQRLSELSLAWGDAITASYTAGIEFVPGWDQAGDTGDLVTDPLAEFHDLSDRRKRQITAFLVQNRKEAHGNAYRIGLQAIRKNRGYGDIRMDRLEAQWLRDIRDFYQDRETCEEQLKSWIEDIGFIVDRGHLQSYRTPDGKIVRKRTAERKMAENG